MSADGLMEPVALRRERVVYDRNIQKHGQRRSAVVLGDFVCISMSGGHVPANLAFDGLGCDSAEGSMTRSSSALAPCV